MLLSCLLYTSAIKAVFRSWDNPRANVYRRMNDIPYSWGTAVNVQPMVFGNLNDKSGTGVAFTRDPATGEKALFGEYLINAQGEDVVAGIRTPSKISKLHEEMPAVYDPVSYTHLSGPDPEAAAFLRKEERKERVLVN